jgi:class 3 adenylate cyclase/tetratricopeptide (TPR) repeat protein
MNCPACGTENRAGRKFCSRCGAAVAPTCPSCGATNDPGDAFCGDCGASLTPEAAPIAAPAAERRLVSVLFADLVGFTPLSEHRDAEEVRDFLSRYFDTCRRLIELYGGTVEKFIGDAVMAVWGAPTATEDDAERAVRAALDLVTAVSALGEELGAEDLRARAGVLTGEAAVTIGVEGEGMIAGDLVNTASRVQSVAEPGSVYVGESTRRATEQTIVYEDAGSFELKGKEGLIPLWRARRVVSGLRGSLKSEGLEAPFVGRERELRQIKELFHSAADAGRAHLVTVTGVAGIGKSRLAWEFYKYFDGIAVSVYWHRGRCLPYGEGVTYWALADMVRMRCRIAEDEDAASAAFKLRSTLEEHVLDSEERRFVEPRLAHLLGLSEQAEYDKQDLFGAWRMLFERLAETYPTVLVFEDLQWADASLLEFVEYLLDWSRSRSLFVVTLARPELLERRPNWGAAQRNFTSLYLEPLPEEAMAELLDGLVPGLPDELRERIMGHAEGVPLYAVETVRMLLGRGLIVEEGPSYRLTGPVEELDVPETLHALIAARLDILSGEERKLLQDAAVLGKTFPRAALAALSGLDEELDALVTSLVRKEVLGVQADVRSPEHGHYGFLQDLMRRVAYESMARRDRRSKHLAAAEYLTGAFEEDEAVEMIASHYVDALDALPETEDAPEIKAKAREMLARAGERTASLAAAAEARRYYEQAAELADQPAERASLLSEAAEMAGRSGDARGALTLLEQTSSLYESLDKPKEAARAAVRLLRFQLFTPDREEAVVRAEKAFELLADEEPDESVAMLAVMLSRVYWFNGDLQRAAERVELALDIAELNLYVRPLSMALRAKAAVAFSRGHIEESMALIKRGLEIALEHDFGESAATAYFLLSDREFRSDRYEEALAHLREGLALARRVGTRPFEWGTLAEMTYPLFMLGRWDEALSMLEDPTVEQTRSGGVLLSLLTSVVEIHLQRGDLDAAKEVFALFSHLEGSTDVQDRSSYLGARASIAAADGRFADALEDAEGAIEAGRTLGYGQQTEKQALRVAFEAALALGDGRKAHALVSAYDDVPPATRSPFLEAEAHRLRARLDGDESRYEAAAAIFRECDLPFFLAVTLLDQGKHLDEAREIFERLRATPWIERLEAMTRQPQPTAS